jgi:hypothetical protein
MRYILQEWEKCGQKWLWLLPGFIPRRQFYFRTVLNETPLQEDVWGSVSIDPFILNAGNRRN